MSAFMESQAALFAERNQAELPQIQHWRQQAMAQAERVGFPSNTREGWKHSPLRALASKRFGARRMAAGNSTFRALAILASIDRNCSGHHLAAVSGG